MRAVRRLGRTVVRDTRVMGGKSMVISLGRPGAAAERFSD
jgi:hypothetical protein